MNLRSKERVRFEDLGGGIPKRTLAVCAPLILWTGYLLYDYADLRGVLQVCFFGVPVTIRALLAVTVAIFSLPLVNLEAWEMGDRLRQKWRRSKKKPRGDSWLFDSRKATLLTALAFAGSCWILRDHNSFPGDQLYWSRFVLRDVSFHVREPLATYYNRLIYLATRGLFPGDPHSSIAFASCLMAIPFWYMTVRLVTELVEGSLGRWLLLLFILSTGAIQLYFGHVETYTVFTTALFFYLFLAVRYLRGQGSLFGCAMAYGLMCAIHFMGLFLGWSILFLVFFAMRRWTLREFLLRTCVGLTGFFVPMLLLVLLILGHMTYYHQALRPDTFLSLINFDAGNVAASLGGADAAMFKPADYSGRVLSFWFSLRHGSELLRHYLLIAPFSVFIFPYSLARVQRYGERFSAERALVWFLLVLNLSYFQLTFVWAPDSGWYGDWSLFAGIGLTLNLMGGMIFLKMESDTRVVRWIGSVVIAAGMVRTAAWVLTNHFSF